MGRSWLGRPTGRHAADARRRPGKAAPVEPAPVEPALPAPMQPDGARPDGAPLFAAPTLADAHPDPVAAAPLSPVTAAARAAAAGTSPRPFAPPWAMPVITLDALGRKCPIPIIMVAERIGDVPIGSVIAVLADDPAAYTDIPAWCGLKSHECVFRAEYATGWWFGIRRSY